MDNKKNGGDNIELCIDKSQLNPFNQKNMMNKKYLQSVFHSITISQLFDPYRSDPTANYVGVLVASSLELSSQLYIIVNWVDRRFYLKFGMEYGLLFFIYRQG